MVDLEWNDRLFRGRTGISAIVLNKLNMRKGKGIRKKNMSYRINGDTIDMLIKNYRDDQEILSMVSEALQSFEKYHQSIYQLEIQRKMYAMGAMDMETYREVIPELDQVRTRTHNSLIGEVKLLNRLAELEKLPPVYEGEVSEERPMRTMIADAVLEYVRQIILDRVTGGKRE